MLYFKTKKGRLIIQSETDMVDPYRNICMVVPPSKEGRLPAHYHSYVSDRVWKYFEKISSPKFLEENEEDMKNYQEVVDLADEFDQEMADQEWMMSMAVHHRKF